MMSLQITDIVDVMNQISPSNKLCTIRLDWVTTISNAICVQPNWKENKHKCSVIASNSFSVGSSVGSDLKLPMPTFLDAVMVVSYKQDASSIESILWHDNFWHVSTTQASPIDWYQDAYTLTTTCR